MFIRKPSQSSSPSKAKPPAAGDAEAPPDCVVDWRWFEDEAAVVPAAVLARAPIRPSASQAITGRR